MVKTNSGPGVISVVCGYLKVTKRSLVLRFLLVGILNTAFGYGMYATFVFLGLPYLYSLLMATVLGVVFNYFSLGKVVFQGGRGKSAFAKFISVYVASYLFNAYLLDTLVTEFLVSPYMSQGICLVPITTLNWLILKNWVFK